jgi:hypothetical protein
MATLAVRTLRLRDIPHIGTVRQRIDHLGGPVCAFRTSALMSSKAISVIPGLATKGRVFVATVDGELCAYLVAQREPQSFKWELAEVAAGSPRLDATDSVCVELWSALVEFTVKQAGANGTKRIFASAADEGPAYDSLRANGFEAFEDRFILSRQLGDVQTGSVPGIVRSQQNSDVWLVHQLYHQVTPRAVQFAEAFTSAEWDVSEGSWFNRAITGVNQLSSYVLESGDDIVGHCRIERKNGTALARLMMEPEYARYVGSFLETCAVVAGVARDDQLQVDVPGYFLEHLGVLEHSGFAVTWERTGLVKHTTASVVVRPKLVPMTAADERERAVRGVPSLYQ